MDCLLAKLWKGLEPRRMSRVRYTPSFSMDGWGREGNALCLTLPDRAVALPPLF